MGLKFRKTFKAGPIRMTVSKSGIGFSAGVKGARITKPAKGKARATVGIPGTGLSYSKTVGGKKKTAAKKTATKKTAPKKTAPKKTDTKKQQPSTTRELTAEDYEKDMGCLSAAARWVFILIMALFVWLTWFSFRTVFPMLAILMAMPIDAWQELLTDKLHMPLISKLSAGAAFALAAMFFTKPGMLALAGMLLVLAILLAVAAKQTTVDDAAADEEATAAEDGVVVEDQTPTAEEAAEPEATQCVSQPAKEPVGTAKVTLESLIAQFENSLKEIPRVAISLSDPAPKHLLKDLPDYSFSNITRTTRLDSIFPLVFLDVETTGLYPSKSEIIEVSAIKFDFGMVPISCFTSLCKPSKPIPEEASAINHITDEMVKDAPSFREIAPALTEYLKGCNIAGHNLDFDLRFIFAHGAELPEGKRFYDTLDLAQLTIHKSDIWNYKLETLCSYYGIWRNKAHRSLSDCYATSKVFSRLVFDKTSRQLENDENAASAVP